MATNWKCASSVQLVISDLNEIAADAYRHRIRSAFKKGGNGVYDRSNGGFKYHLPDKLSVNRRARFEVIRIDADSLEIRAASIEDPTCSVTAVVNSRGGLGDIMFPGRSRSVEENRPTMPHGVPQAYQPASAGRPVLFFEEQ